MQDDCLQLMKLLTQSVERNWSDVLLLSGGLDSSILASILHPVCSVTTGFGSCAPDLIYARQIARKYSKKHVEVIVDSGKMLDMVSQIIQIFKTFDPIEIRNSCVVLAGIEQAKNEGYSKIMTGDGGDELFAGYNYLARYYSDLPRLDQEMHRLWQIMHFSAIALGQHVGVEVKTPFLDNEFALFAKSLGVIEKVGEHTGEKFGKFILRKCFEMELGNIVWRRKLAQEQGAATDRYPNYIENMIDDLTFANRAKVAQEESVRIRNKEHLHYYAIFRSYFPPPKEEWNGCESHCPECSGCIPADIRFCRICGAFPVTPKLL
jgi:asparagine synthase (glutamine-hydrolysing)